MFEDYASASPKQSYCEKLLEAIDFFTQSLHLEQLSYYGYELVHEILSLDSSALFIREDGVYKLKHQKQYPFESYEIPETSKLRKVATLFGRVMTVEQKEYFQDQELEDFQVKLVIPLIVKDQLVGFIFSNALKFGEFDHDFITLSGALMQLMNRSYENARNFMDLEQKNYELDKKIFNLFFVNHCSRTLLSELNLDNIYSICIDIVRELTSSAVTSFGLFDETRHRIVLKGYQDIITFQNYYTELDLQESFVVPSKVVYHIEKDRKELEKIFCNCNQFLDLKAEYIVLLVKEQILGFVTIGKPVSERVYDQTLFELIETIATSIYISIENAMLFEKINQQRELINKKFEVLHKLNRTTRNINSCESLEELCQISMQSLQIGYGVKKAFMCVFQDDVLKVMGDVHIPHLNGEILEMGSELHKLDESGIHYEYGTVNIQKFFPEFEPARHVDANCLVVAPIRIDRLALGERGTLGYLVVFETESALKEEEVLLIDTLSNSIAPIVFQMNEIKRVQTQYVENHERKLLEDIKDKIANREAYFIEFKVWYKKISKKPFEEIRLDKYTELNYFIVDQMLFCPVEDEIHVEEELFDGHIVLFDLDDFIKQVRLL